MLFGRWTSSSLLLCMSMLACISIASCYVMSFVAASLLGFVHLSLFSLSSRQVPNPRERAARSRAAQSPGPVGGESAGRVGGQAERVTLACAEPLEQRLVGAGFPLGGVGGGPAGLVGEVGQVRPVGGDDPQDRTVGLIWVQPPQDPGVPGRGKPASTAACMRWGWPRRRIAPRRRGLRYALVRYMVTPPAAIWGRAAPLAWCRARVRLAHVYRWWRRLPGAARTAC